MLPGVQQEVELCSKACLFFILVDGVVRGLLVFPLILEVQWFEVPLLPGSAVQGLAKDDGCWLLCSLPWFIILCTDGGGLQAVWLVHWFILFCTDGGGLLAVWLVHWFILLCTDGGGLLAVWLMASGLWHAGAGIGRCSRLPCRGAGQDSWPAGEILGMCLEGCKHGARVSENACVHVFACVCAGPGG